MHSLESIVRIVIGFVIGFVACGLFWALADSQPDGLAESEWAALAAIASAVAALLLLVVSVLSLQTMARAASATETQARANQLGATVSAIQALVIFNDQMIALAERQGARLVNADELRENAAEVVELYKYKKKLMGELDKISRAIEADLNLAESLRQPGTSPVSDDSESSTASA